MPEAEWRGPLPPTNYSKADRTVIGMTIHHMDGSWESADATFHDPHRGASACFGVTYEGHIIQWVDTKDFDYHACQAQYEGYVGIENESDPNDVNAPLTDAQVAACARIGVWLGIPARIIGARGEHGVGWHRQFPGPCSQAWGQTDCPGDGIVNVSVPAIVAAMQPKPEDDDPMLYVFNPHNPVEVWALAGNFRRHVVPDEWDFVTKVAAYNHQPAPQILHISAAWFDSYPVAA